MSFVRIKRIKGRRFAYLVSSEWTSKGPRQKVSKYLGPLIETGEAERESLSEHLEGDPVTFIDEKTFHESVRMLIGYELTRHGFSRDGDAFTNGSVKVNGSDFQTTNKAKNVVIALNSGHLCAQSAGELLAYTPADDPTGSGLGRLLVSAGIAVDEEVFIALFEKTHQQDPSETIIHY